MEMRRKATHLAFAAGLGVLAATSLAVGQTTPAPASTDPVAPPSGTPGAAPADPASPPSTNPSAEPTPPPAQPTAPAEPAPLAESPMLAEEPPPTAPPPPPPSDVPEDSGSDRSAGPFSRGSIRLTLLVGWGSTVTEEYLILGGGPGYFLADGLEIGLDYEAWLFGEPVMHRLSPETRYIFHMVPVIKPYVGVFYRHTF